MAVEQKGWNHSLLAHRCVRSLLRDTNPSTAKVKATIWAVWGNASWRAVFLCFSSITFWLVAVTSKFPWIRGNSGEIECRLLTLASRIVRRWSFPFRLTGVSHSHLHRNAEIYCRDDFILCSKLKYSPCIRAQLCTTFLLQPNRNKIVVIFFLQT